jgi:hypothetical protein
MLASASDLDPPVRAAQHYLRYVIDPSAVLLVQVPHDGVGFIDGAAGVWVCVYGIHISTCQMKRC